MKKLTAALGVLAFFAAVGSASAASITWNLTSEFSGGADPLNTLTAVIDDGGTPGSVTLTMTMTGGSTTEFIDAWYFNFSGDSSTLSFSLTTNTTGSGTDPVVTQINDCCKADGDGLYDIRIVFDNAPPAQRFTTGETVVYTITGTGITAADFNVLSAPDGGNGPFYTAAHVQGIANQCTPENPCTSGWVTIPEPSGAILFGLGTLLAGAAIRRRS
jgi:hypothetical protein